MLTIDNAPPGICGNCLAVWRSRRPRPAGVYCWHNGMAARPAPAGWQLEEASSKGALERLRQEGIR